MAREQNVPIVWREKKDRTLCESSYRTNYAQGFSGVYRRMTHFCELKRLHEGPHYCFCNGYELTWYEFSDVVKEPKKC